MALQRGYATTLLQYIRKTNASLEQTISQLQYEPSLLEQEMWERLHRLNRRPKPCYIAGLSATAETYVRARAIQIAARHGGETKRAGREARAWKIRGLRVDATSHILQSKEGRVLQDTFGFVGVSVGGSVIEPVDFNIEAFGLCHG